MKYGDKLLNKKSNPNLKKKEVKFQVSFENETQLSERLTKLGITLKIKDYPVNKFFYYDGNVDGKRYRSAAKYNKTPKEEAISKLIKKQQQLIEELTIDFK